MINDSKIIKINNCLNPTAVQVSDFNNFTLKFVEKFTPLSKDINASNGKIEFVLNEKGKFEYGFVGFDFNLELELQKKAGLIRNQKEL